MQNISEAKVKKYSIASYGIGSAFIMLSGLVIGLWIVLGPRFNELFSAKDTDSLSGGIFYSTMVCTGLWVLLLILLVFFVSYYNKIARNYREQELENDQKKDLGQQPNPNPVVVNINNPNPLLNNNRPNNGPIPNTVNQPRPMQNGPQGPRPMGPTQPGFRPAPQLSSGRPIINGGPQGPRPMQNGPQGPRPMAPVNGPQGSKPMAPANGPIGPKPMVAAPQGPRPMVPTNQQRPPMPPRPGNR